MACGRWVLSEADNPPSHFDSKSLNHNIVKFNFKLVFACALFHTDNNNSCSSSAVRLTQLPVELCYVLMILPESLVLFFRYKTLETAKPNYI